MIRFVALLSFLFCLLILNAWPALAQKTATPSATPKSTSSPVPTESDRLQKIKSLKERVATRVAELREREKTILGGTIKEIEDESFTLNYLDKALTIYVSTNTEVASVSGTKKTPLKIQNLRPGDVVALSAVAGRKADSWEAQEILVRKVTPSYLIGKVSAVDTEGGTITVTARAQSRLVDIELTTKLNRFSVETGKIAKSGLSKIRIGDFAHVLATPTSGDASKKLPGLRILVFTLSDLSPTPPPAGGPTTSASLTPTVKPTVTYKPDVTP